MKTRRVYFDKFSYLILLSMLVCSGYFYSSGTSNNEVKLTHQVPDLLVTGSDTLRIFSNPLESIFKDTNQRPEEIIEDDCYSTACWRGYQALWELADNRLFLKEISSCCSDFSLNDKQLTNLTKRNFHNGRIFADWYSDTLIIPLGDLLHYEHMGYSSIYEREVHIFFKSGVVMGRDTLNNYPTKDPTFPTGIEGFQELVIKNLHSKFLTENDSLFLIVLNVKKDGTAVVDTLYRNKNLKLLKEVKRIVGQNQNWSPGYRRGEKVEMTYVIPIHIKN